MEEQFQDLNVKLVEDIVDLEDIFYPIYAQTFTDPKEQLSLENVKEWFINAHVADSHSLFYLIYAGEKAIGFRFIIYSDKLQIAYVPYGGLIKEYRGKGIYPAISDLMISELVGRKIELIVNECENPLKVAEEEKLVAQKRLAMFINKLDYKFVAEDKVPYTRNALPIHSPDEIKQTWDHYLLGFTLLVKNTDVITVYPDKISKEDYKKLYMAIRYFEHDTNDETELRKIPAVNLFLSRLEAYPEEYVDLIF